MSTTMSVLFYARKSMINPMKLFLDLTFTKNAVELSKNRCLNCFHWNEHPPTLQ